jgi:hypothetical protein
MFPVASFTPSGAAPSGGPIVVRLGQGFSDAIKQVVANMHPATSAMTPAQQATVDAHTSGIAAESGLVGGSVGDPMATLTGEAETSGLDAPLVTLGNTIVTKKQGLIGAGVVAGALIAKKLFF